MMVKLEEERTREDAEYLKRLAEALETIGLPTPAQHLHAISRRLFDHTEYLMTLRVMGVKEL